MLLPKDFSFLLNLTLYQALSKFYPVVLLYVYNSDFFKDKPLPLSFDNIIRMNRIALHLILKHNSDNFKRFMKTWSILYKNACNSSDSLIFIEELNFNSLNTVKAYFCDFPEHFSKLFNFFYPANPMRDRVRYCVMVAYYNGNYDS